MNHNHVVKVGKAFIATGVNAWSMMSTMKRECWKVSRSINHENSVRFESYSAN